MRLLAVLRLLILLAAVVSNKTIAQSSEEYTSEDDVTLDSIDSSLAPGSSAIAPAEPKAELPVAEAVETPVTTEPSTPAQVSEEETQQEDDEEEEEEVAEEAKPEEAKEVAAAPTPAIQSTEASSQAEVSTDNTSEPRMFGSKKIRLSMHKPTFTEKQKLLETLYGKPRDYFSFGVDWFPLDWWVNPGIGGSIGGFSWTGKAGKALDSTKPISEDNLTVDENSNATLLFVPIQATFKVEMTPFRKKWLVLEGWTGMEYGWWQETRPQETTAMTTAWSIADTTTTSEEKPVLTSKGVSNGMVVGASAHILLNWMDEKSSRSMISTMGLSSIYLTPFFETITSTKKDGYTFGRNVYGIGFTFESYR